MMDMGVSAIYPGSFDPVTLGHVDIIRRAAKVFGEVIAAVANNTQKKTLFTSDERVLMLREATKDIKGVKVEAFKGLAVDFAKKHDCNILIRGLRMISDFDFEFQMALTNRRLDETIETVFLMPSAGYSFISSTLLKEAALLGADVSSFVPDFLVEKLKERLQA